MVGRMDAPGRWAGGFRAWDEHGVYLATGAGRGGGAGAAGACRRRCASSARRWFPFGVHLIEGLVQHRAQHRVDGPAARVAGRRWARWPPGSPTRSTTRRRRRPARSTRWTGACETLLVVAAPAGRRPRSGRAVRRASTSCGSRSAAGAPAAGRARPRRTARRSSPTWLRRHGVERDWVIAAAARRGRRRRRPGATGSPTCSTVPLEPGPGVGGQHAARRSACWPRSGSRPRRVSELVGAVRSYSQMDRALDAAGRRHRGHREHAGHARPQARAAASRWSATTTPDLPRDRGVPR